MDGKEVFLSGIKADTREALFDYLNYNDKQYEVLDYKNGKQERGCCSLKNVKLRKRDSKNQPVIYIPGERNT